jgi:hypothetical protein
MAKLSKRVNSIDAKTITALINLANNIKINLTGRIRDDGFKSRSAFGSVALRPLLLSRLTLQPLIIRVDVVEPVHLSQRQRRKKLLESFQIQNSVFVDVT